MTEQKTEQKIEAFWRDATAEDIAKVMRGEKVEARFRDVDTSIWSVNRILGGYDATCPNSLHWISDNANQWKFCQVYDPPQWYIDKPDPGEGWRLLDPFTDEQPELGDCMFDRIDKKWISLVPNFLPGRRPSVWYRRRIEPVNSPEKLDSSPCVGFPKGWTDLSVDEPRLASDAYWSQDAEAWVLIGDGWVEAANREKWPAIRFGNPSKSSNSSIPPVGSLSGFKVGDHVREVDNSSGYAYLGIGMVEDIGNVEDFPIGVRYGKRFYAAYKPEQLEKLPQFSKHQRVKVVNKHFVHSGRIGVVDSTSSDGMVHIHFSPSETGLYEPCDIVAVD